LVKRFQEPEIFQRIVLGVGAVLMGVKFFAWVVTGSNAIFSDALESIVNIAAGFLALTALRIAAKPNDRDHPYGHGKIEFISAGVEGTMIGLAGVAAIVKAGYNLLYPQELSSLDLGLVLSAFAGAVNYALGIFSEKIGDKHRSAALSASGKHLQTDAFTTVGLLAGLGLVRFSGLVWVDNVVAMVFGALIIITGVKVIRTSLAALMDESDFELIRSVLETVNKTRDHRWIDLHNLRVMRVGSAIHIDCHLTLPWYLQLSEAHAQIHEFENHLRQAFKPYQLECFVHADACVPASCAVCRIENCPARKHAFQEAVPWTLEHVMQTEKHRLSDLAKRPKSTSII
jgi:cation diffusion facilitator family transporter